MLFFAINPPISNDCLDYAYLSILMSKALPVVRVIFSSFGVWSIESSPINYNEPSVSSDLNTLTVPLGNGMPNLFSCEFLSYILLLAFKFSSEYPPLFTVTE